MHLTQKFLAAALAAAVAASLATMVVPAHATTTTSSLGVSATVVSSCVVSGATLNFGSAIDPTSASLPIDASTTMTVQCTATTPYSVALNAGLNAGSATNFSARAMKSGSLTLGYQLYADTLRTVVWGDGTSLSGVLPGVGTGSNQTLTIYGRLPSLTGTVPGTYTDTVTVTVTY